MKQNLRWQEINSNKVEALELEVQKSYKKGYSIALDEIQADILELIDTTKKPIIKKALQAIYRYLTNKKKEI